MNPSPARRKRPTGRLLRVGSGLGLLLLLFLPLAAGAQPVLSEREARYREAISRFNTFTQAFDRAFQRHVEATDNLTRARGTPAANDAFITFQDRVFELNAVERDLRAALDELRARGGALLQTLDQEEERILDQAQQATLPGVREALALRLVEVRERRRVVAQEVEQFGVPVIQPLPDLVARPQDGPVQLMIKASLNEERAEEYRDAVVDLTRQIEQLERRLARERAIGDITADVRRDADRQPGGGVIPRPIPSQRPGDDRSAAQELISQLPLDEQLEVLRGVRTRVQELERQAMAQAALFRRLAQGGAR